MTAPARVVALRGAPGLAGWAALPERDRAVLLWLLVGDIITAELAALLAYGHRRIAQRRLARLAEYGLVSGSWAANRQRPRGRYAYALTKAARTGLERLVWPDGRARLDGGVEVVSPVIHGLATHDLFAAFLRASEPATETGVASWVPERACLRLFGGWLRPDALAVIRVGARSIVLLIERDLGTERGAVLPEKIRRYRSAFSRSSEGPPIHVGIVVDSARRAASVGRSIARSDRPGPPVHVWVLAERPSPSIRSGRSGRRLAAGNCGRWTLRRTGAVFPGRSSHPAASASRTDSRASTSGCSPRSRRSLRSSVDARRRVAPVVASVAPPRSTVTTGSRPCRDDGPGKLIVPGGRPTPKRDITP